MWEDSCPGKEGRGSRGQGKDQLYPKTLIPEPGSFMAMVLERVRMCARARVCMYKVFSPPCSQSTYSLSFRHHCAPHNTSVSSEGKDRLCGSTLDAHH